jgi:hypothetical protein
MPCAAACERFWGLARHPTLTIAHSEMAQAFAVFDAIPICSFAIPKNQWQKGYVDGCYAFEVSSP